jgi:stress response protein YsnF
VTETQNVQVPVSREEIVVERVPAEGQAATDWRRKGNPDTSRRRTRQGEEDSDRAGKGSEVEDTRDIPDETRREELRVEKEGDVRELDDSEVEKSRRKKTA